MLPTHDAVRLWTGCGVFATRPTLKGNQPIQLPPPGPVRGGSEEAGEGKPTLRGRRVHYGKHSTKSKICRLKKIVINLSTSSIEQASSEEKAR